MKNKPEVFSNLEPSLWIEILRYRQQKQTKALFEEHSLMILSGVRRPPLIKSKARGTKMEKALVFGTRFVTAEEKYTTMTPEMSPAIATTKSTKI